MISGGAHVEVNGKLEIVGSNQNMENLVTITAATKCRHFSLNGADKTLVLRFVKLVGGDVRAADLNQDAGSIYAVNGVEIYIYSSTIVGNFAEKGGAVFVYEGKITVFRSCFPAKISDCYLK